MRRVHWLALGGILALTSVVVIVAGSTYLRIEPFPTKEEILRAQKLRRAKRLRERPSLKDIPPIEPMKIEQALILEEIGGLFPGKREASERPQPPSMSEFYPISVARLEFRTEYVSEEDAGGCQEFNLYGKNQPAVQVCNSSYGDMGIPVIVKVQQFPHEAWPLYLSKWSPDPDTLSQENPDLDITRVTRFKNRIVMNRQWRFPDETGKLLVYWPSGKNLISITFTSKVIQEEFLKRYLEKYPSSL